VDSARRNVEIGHLTTGKGAGQDSWTDDVLGSDRKTISSLSVVQVFWGNSMAFTILTNMLPLLVPTQGLAHVEGVFSSTASSRVVRVIFNNAPINSVPAQIKSL